MVQAVFLPSGEFAEVVGKSRLWAENQPKVGRKASFSADFWSGWQESNLLELAPKASGWPLPYIPIFSFFCQIRKWSNLWSKVFRRSTRRRKSEKTREKRRFCEISAVDSRGGHTLPNHARYQLRYTPIHNISIIPHPPRNVKNFP